jgi:hypothetical protein
VLRRGVTPRDGAGRILHTEASTAGCAMIKMCVETAAREP